MVANFFKGLSKGLLSCFSVAVCLIGTMSSDGFSGSALASSEKPILLDMPIYNRISNNDLIDRAESMVSQEIERHFDTDASLAEVKIVVLGNRNGDVIPVLTTTVSRTQWQGNPQVSAWTQYYSSAYALLQRHDRQQPAQVAAAPTSRPAARTTSWGIATQFEQQFDAGQVTGRTVQAYADLVD